MLGESTPIMELNNIVLSPFLTAGWYKNSLVNEPDNHPAPGEIDPSKLDWKYLGNNDKNVVIVVDYPEATPIPDEHLPFLTSVLSACGLSLPDVAIINFHHTKHFSYKAFTAYFKCQAVLLFGIEPAAFGLPPEFPAYQVQSISGSRLLYISSLPELEKNTGLKSKLWTCLRTLFGI